MISLHGVSKFYDTRYGRHYVFRDVDLTFRPSQHVAIMGRNGSGKSTLLRMLGGSENPNEGQIERDCQVSWTLGLSGGFQGSMTGEENVRFVCMVNGLDADEVEEVVEFVLTFSEIGDYFHMPVNTYSSGMRGRVSFGLSLCFNFDFYLVDELTSVGDAGFRKKAVDAFEKLKERASLIYASHNLKSLEESCDVALVVRDGRIDYFESVEEAVEEYEESLLKRAAVVHEGLE